MQQRVITAFPIVVLGMRVIYDIYVKGGFFSGDSKFASLYIEYLVRF